MADYHFNKTKTVAIADAEAFEKALYIAAGMEPEDAERVGVILVEADARGVYSHGIQRNHVYLERFERGGNDPKAKPEIVRQFGATALIDAHNCMGMISCEFGMKLAIDIARKYGTSAVSITGSNHFGTCAHYLKMATDAGMIGFMWTQNSVNIMAPWGGTERQLGNNPFGIGAPCKTKAPVIMDMATSVVARGKIVMAKKTNTPIPDTWALDVNGNRTTDPQAAYLGTVQPYATYKGYCQTLMNAIISAILNQSAFGPDVIDLYEETDKIQNAGHLIQCIDINAIDDLDSFLERMDQAVDYIKSGKKADGVSEILVPGEASARRWARARLEGISYPVEVIEEANGLAEKYGIKERL